jgi:hypothetical protein
MRGFDYNLMDEELLERCSPIRRQLLGDGNDIKGWWQPTEEDVPLKGFLESHAGGRHAVRHPLVALCSRLGSTPESESLSGAWIS